MTRSSILVVDDTPTNVRLLQALLAYLLDRCGESTSTDIPAAELSERFRIAPEALEEHLSLLNLAMRMAGPREAVWHAIIRKNHGLTHFIVGRDHAGVGSFYGTFDAQRIFDRFTPEELGIIPLKFDHAFYCRACGGMATARTCPHGSGSRVALSGTRVRELLRRGERLPEEFTRPEVAEVLLASAAQSRAGAGR